MNAEHPRFLIQIECYDAYGFYEENVERILLVMENLAKVKIIKRDWVRAQAVGGSWARAVRYTLETAERPMQIKKWMVGLEYRRIEELPKSLQHLASKVGLFRFADIDVIELAGGANRGVLRRLVSRIGIGARKVEKAELSNNARKPSFLAECREELVSLLTSDVQRKLFEVEQRIFEQLEGKPPIST